MEWLSKNQLIVGWVMGVISSPLGNWLHSFVERRRFVNAAGVELRELRFRLAALLFGLAGPLGKRDRTFLMWVKVELESYRRTPEQELLIEGTDQLLNVGDDQLAVANATRTGKSVPSVVIPYLNAQADMIRLLSTRRQEALVNLLHQVEVINSKNREMANWDKATFEVTTTGNHQNAAQNSLACMGSMFSAGRQAADWIRKFTESKTCW